MDLQARHLQATKAPDAVILPESPAAATYRTDVKGWVSRGGLLYGNNEQGERLARRQGATHLRCECGALHDKLYTCCEKCREARRHERWLMKPIGQWDGSDLVYSDLLNEFLSAEDLEEKQEEHGDLDLLICDPVKLRPVDAEYWADDLALDDDQAELPLHVLEAIDALNAELEKAKPLSWQPGDFRVENEGAGQS